MLITVLKTISELLFQMLWFLLIFFYFLNVIINLYRWFSFLGQHCYLGNCSCDSRLYFKCGILQFVFVKIFETESIFFKWPSLTDMIPRFRFLFNGNRRPYFWRILILREKIITFLTFFNCLEVLWWKFIRFQWKFGGLDY